MSATDESPKFLLNEKVIVNSKDDYFLSKCINVKKTKDGYKVG
jgi:hypothetical protein